MHKLNEQQEDILKTEGNVLVQASAGTGKTTILIAKIEQLLSQGKKHLLILTFSNIAVNTIRYRLQNDNFDFSGCQITTIHAFCNSLIKDNLMLTPLGQNYIVADDVYCSHIKQKIMLDIINEKIQNNESLVYELTRYINNEFFQQTPQSFLVNLYDKINIESKLQEWLITNIEKYNVKDDAKMQFTYQMALVIKDILLSFDKKYSDYKIKKNIIDFSDMEKYALIILNNSFISDKYKNFFDYILVDEYQDTNITQETIINLIAKNNLFCVGDLKQSIYGFRLAKPEILLNRSDEYSSSGAGVNKLLTGNYRSSQNIINFVNDIFGDYKDTSGFFSKNSNLVHFRKNEDKKYILPISVNILSSPVNHLDSKTCNIQNIVDVINNCVGKLIYDSTTGETRKCEYGDILILSRNLMSVKDSLCSKLKENNIPFSISQPGNLLNEPEIKQFISIVKMFLFHNDIDIINFMHHGYLNFTDDDLFKLRDFDIKKSLYENLASSNMFPTFKALLDKKRKGDLISELAFVVTDVNFLNSILEIYGSNIPLENFSAFIDFACRTFNTHTDWQLTDFILYIDDLYSTGSKIKEIDLNFNNSVKISTIHSAKGAESPIVLLAFCDTKFKSTSDAISFDYDEGLGLKYYNYEKKEKSSTPLKDKIDNLNKYKQELEEMRLLYVALTRAREKLYIIGLDSSSIKEGNSYMKIIQDCLSNISNFTSKVNIDNIVI